jgi:hypothetical protein
VTDPAAGEPPPDDVARQTGLVLALASAMARDDTDSLAPLLAGAASDPDPQGVLLTFLALIDRLLSVVVEQRGGAVTKDALLRELALTPVDDPAGGDPGH